MSAKDTSSLKTAKQNLGSFSVKNLPTIFWRASLTKKFILMVILIAIGVGIRQLIVSRNNKVTYQTATAEKGTIVATVSASGQAVASNYLTITTQATGVVKSVLVKNGDKVVKGQKIAEITLDSTGAQTASLAYSAYLSAKNALFNTQNNLYSLQITAFSTNQKLINDAVARDLSTDDPTYIQENAAWLAAEANYKNQQNVLNQSQTALANAWITYQNSSSTVTAPSNGIINNITLAPGLNLTSTSAQRIAVILTGGNPLVTVNLSELDIDKVSPSQKVTITFDSIADKTFTGKVASVDKIGTVTSGVTNYPAVIIIDTAATEILPNMSASANIITATKENAVMVPSAAVITQNGSTVVRILKNNQININNVETGLSSDSQIEIISGVREGDIIVTSVSSTTTQTSGSTQRSIFSGGVGGGAVFRSGGR